MTELRKASIKPESLITEPTNKMVEAGERVFKDHLLRDPADYIVAKIYKAMEKAKGEA